jgi:LPS-assembly lipoprotein
MKIFKASYMAFAVGFGLTLSACGFTPMYGTSGVGAGLEDIRVETGQDRVDFFLQEALLDQMGSRSANGPLTLSTQTRVNSVPLGLGVDAIASRFAIRVNVNYTILSQGEVEPIISGRASGEASYDVSSSVYGSLSAERDAVERAAQIAADQIVVQIARALHNRPEQ